MTDNDKTVAGIIKSGADYLAKKGVESPRTACEYLLGRLLNCPHLNVYAKDKETLNEKQLEAMRRGIKRVASGEPVQYVTGRTDFMGHAFKTDPRALIPRPETETLVHAVLQEKELWNEEKPIIVDIGTGSGCIIISLAKEKPNAVYIAIDKSEEAISLAQENAETLKVKDNIVFTANDMSDFIEPATIDAVVTNPPYIATADYERLPIHIREHEPRTALDGGPTGLAVTENIIQDAAIILKPNGFLFLEIGETQANDVTLLLQKESFSNISVEKDIAGKNRIVTARNAGI